jgi:activator of HSP90 ATPase
MVKGKTTGLTKDAGYQVGVRKTIEGSHLDVWNFLLSNTGLEIWLGNIDPDDLARREEISLSNGTTVKITRFKLQSHLRMQWRKKSWATSSRLQLRVIAAGYDKTTISFHQEMLENDAQREAMKSHWRHILIKLEAAFTETT